MAFSFSDLRKKVLKERTLNPAFFAESVTYKREGQPDISLAAHVKHSVRYDEDREMGGEFAVEQIAVTLDRDAFSPAPARGDRVLRAGDSRAYVFAYAGKNEPHFYRAVFERRALVVQHA